MQKHSDADTCASPNGVLPRTGGGETVLVHVLMQFSGRDEIGLLIEADKVAENLQCGWKCMAAMVQRFYGGAGRPPVQSLPFPSPPPVSHGEFHPAAV